MGFFSEIWDFIKNALKKLVAFIKKVFSIHIARVPLFALMNDKIMYFCYATNIKMQKKCGSYRYHNNRCN